MHYRLMALMLKWHAYTESVPIHRSAAVNADLLTLQSTVHKKKVTFLFCSQILSCPSQWQKASKNVHQFTSITVTEFPKNVNQVHLFPPLEMEKFWFNETIALALQQSSRVGQFQNTNTPLFSGKSTPLFSGKSTPPFSGKSIPPFSGKSTSPFSGKSTPLFSGKSMFQIHKPQTRNTTITLLQNQTIQEVLFNFFAPKTPEDVTIKKQ